MDSTYRDEPMREAPRRSPSPAREKDAPSYFSQDRREGDRRDRRRSGSRERYRSPARSQRDRRDDKPAPDPCNVLGVFGLSQYTGNTELRDIFEKFGKIQDISLITDKEGNSKCFAFIKFDNMDEATEALRATNGMELSGRRIRVDYSVTKQAHQPTPGRYMGAPSRRSRSPPRRRRSPPPYYRRRSRTPEYRRHSRSPKRRRSTSRGARRSRSGDRRRRSPSRNGGGYSGGGGGGGW